MAAPAIVMLRAAALVRTNGSDVRVRPTPQLRTTIVLGLSCPLTPCPCDPLHALGQRIPCASFSVAAVGRAGAKILAGPREKAAKNPGSARYRGLLRWAGATDRMRT